MAQTPIHRYTHQNTLHKPPPHPATCVGRSMLLTGSKNPKQPLSDIIGRHMLWEITISDVMSCSWQHIPEAQADAGRVPLDNTQQAHLRLKAINRLCVETAQAVQSRPHQRKLAHVTGHPHPHNGMPLWLDDATTGPLCTSSSSDTSTGNTSTHTSAGHGKRATSTPACPCGPSP
jgi:hypothetical protein